MNHATEEDIARAVEILRAGGLVAFPTETVYGLGADASSAEAVAKVFAAKGRPQTHPLIVHIAAAAQLPLWAAEIPEAATKLAQAFWPGPLTIVLKKKPEVIAAVTGGQDTIALRVPSHPVAHALLEAFGGGIAAPSANKFGRISPTTAEHVRADLGAEVELVLEGGASDVGIESTIVDLSRGHAVLLRPGRVKAEDILRVLGDLPEAPDASAPRAPGSHEAHYAPRAALKIVPARRDFTDELASHRGRRVAVLALEISVPRVQQALQRVLPASATLYAQGLYAKLRELDAEIADLILVEAPPKGSAWEGVWDRLKRAQHAHAHGVRQARADAPWRKKKAAAAADDASGFADGAADARPDDGGASATDAGAPAGDRAP
jgi:L-threonylcarbamoyladenylate synthase